MNNNDYREITEDDVTTVSTDQKEEMNGQESVNDTPDVSENEKETVHTVLTDTDVVRDLYHLSCNMLRSAADVADIFILRLFLIRYI